MKSGCPNQKTADKTPTVPSLRQTIGRRGEELAAAFLRTKGFKVVAQNWSTRLGEIDLIVERNGEVRFIEVKCRSSLKYGYPEEAITKTKRAHLAHAMELWLRSHPVTRYQADAVAILLRSNREPEIHWIEGIL